MALTTAQREERIAAAIDDFHSHEGTISVRKIALKHKVSHVTLGHRLQRQQSKLSNGGQNRLLSTVEIGAIFHIHPKASFCRLSMYLADACWCSYLDPGSKQPTSTI